MPEVWTHDNLSRHFMPRSDTVFQLFILLCSIVSFMFLFNWWHKITDFIEIRKLLEWNSGTLSFLPRIWRSYWTNVLKSRTMSHIWTINRYIITRRIKIELLNNVIRNNRNQPSKRYVDTISKSYIPELRHHWVYFTMTIIKTSNNSQTRRDKMLTHGNVPQSFNMNNNWFENEKQIDWIR